MAQYKLYYDPLTKQIDAVLDTETNTSFLLREGTVAYRKYQAWLAEGNTPDPADPLPPPIDLSDSDQLEVALKALLACVAQVGGLTQAQAKAMFKQKYDQISNQ